jgi:DNA-binding NarL/FixJ family response regulator
MTIRIVLAEDQLTVRAGLAMLLDAQPDFDVVAEAGDGAEAVKLAHYHAPDVVVMDVRMPIMDGVTATRQITEAGTGIAVLILTTFHADDNVYEALRAGAKGFLLKDGAPGDLVNAIRALTTGGCWLDQNITRAVIANLAVRPRSTPAPEILGRLTPREREILDLMAHGLTNLEIAAHLVLSEATVKSHVCHIIMKLDVRDRTQAVVTAYQSGLVGSATAGTPARSPSQPGKQ